MAQREFLRVSSSFLPHWYEPSWLIVLSGHFGSLLKLPKRFLSTHFNISMHTIDSISSSAFTSFTCGPFESGNLAESWQIFCVLISHSTHIYPSLFDCPENTYNFFFCDFQTLNPWFPSKYAPRSSTRFRVLFRAILGAEHRTSQTAHCAMVHESPPSKTKKTTQRGGKGKRWK